MNTFRAAILCALVALAGCAKDDPPPIYLAADAPQLPEQCFPDQVSAPKEPKLADRDNTDVDAVKDRQAWKAAFRAERSHRATCAQRLDALFPSKERGKPTT